jgi:hypothetical protein
MVPKWYSQPEREALIAPFGTAVRSGGSVNYLASGILPCSGRSLVGGLVFRFRAASLCQKPTREERQRFRLDQLE